MYSFTITHASFIVQQRCRLPFNRPWRRGRVAEKATHSRSGRSAASSHLVLSAPPTPNVPSRPKKNADKVQRVKTWDLLTTPAGENLTNPWSRSGNFDDKLAVAPGAKGRFQAAEIPYDLPHPTPLEEDPAPVCLDRFTGPEALTTRVPNVSNEPDRGKQDCAFSKGDSFTHEVDENIQDTVSYPPAEPSSGHPYFDEGEPNSREGVIGVQYAMAEQNGPESSVEYPCLSRSRAETHGRSVNEVKEGENAESLCVGAVSVATQGKEETTNPDVGAVHTTTAILLVPGEAEAPERTRQVEAAKLSSDVHSLIPLAENSAPDCIRESRGEVRVSAPEVSDKNAQSKQNGAVCGGFTYKIDENNRDTAPDHAVVPSSEHPHSDEQELNSSEGVRLQHGVVVKQGPKGSVESQSLFVSHAEVRKRSASEFQKGEGDAPTVDDVSGVAQNGEEGAKPDENAVQTTAMDSLFPGGAEAVEVYCNDNILSTSPEIPAPQCFSGSGGVVRASGLEDSENTGRVERNCDFSGGDSSTYDIDANNQGTLSYPTAAHSPGYLDSDKQVFLSSECVGLKHAAPLIVQQMRENNAGKCAECPTSSIPPAEALQESETRLEEKDGAILPTVEPVSELIQDGEDGTKPDESEFQITTMVCLTPDGAEIGIETKGAETLETSTLEDRDCNRRGSGAANASVSEVSDEIGHIEQNGASNLGSSSHCTYEENKSQRRRSTGSMAATSLDQPNSDEQEPN